ncbi:methylated-DNA--[protein]-cysteine S-methyltransferase [Thermosipho ferrireducens]|uniref:Methylated-DNA--[protein]-cysteine S-methyltransferase n=1 Tax=Thermosipho ferrireducens TaxID=2571116 RepID=A0ABX7S8E4_9BACT|nr:methylated-DNA--[protein]-cysteine S-methyltransferase [Thermosipho ferrireducens]QTA37380.1 methylated-DNA--[protein]-cysteine S-methyltransferase [Thermosipho ferrireducens]
MYRTKGIVTTKIGSIVIAIVDGKAVAINFVNKKLEERNAGDFTEQVKEYFSGERKVLDFPVNIKGGLIFRKIWETVRKIPYGEIMTYGEVAKQLNINPRVVGFAMAKNPLPLYIPCHRIVGKNELGGFTPGISWKKFLLSLERRFK